MTPCFAARYGPASGVPTRPPSDDVVDDDSAAVLRHMEELVLHAEPNALQVDLHDAVEVVLLDVGGETDGEDSRVVEGEVNRSISVSARANEITRTASAFVTSAGDEGGVAAGVTDQPHRRFRILAAALEVVHHDGRAFASVGNRRCAAYASCAPGDQAFLPLKHVLPTAYMRNVAD
jgi:hypothetical protein